MKKKFDESQVYSALGFAPMAGSLALATGVTGTLYDHYRYRHVCAMFPRRFFD